MPMILPATSTLLTFVAASFAILIVPGPSVSFVVARSVEYGRLAGLCSMLDLETGAMHATAAALGLTALVASSGAAFFVGLAALCDGSYAILAALA